MEILLGICREFVVKQGLQVQKHTGVENVTNMRYAGASCLADWVPLVVEEPQANTPSYCIPPNPVRTLALIQFCTRLHRPKEDIFHQCASSSCKCQDPRFFLISSFEFSPFYSLLAHICAIYLANKKELCNLHPAPH